MKEFSIRDHLGRIGYAKIDEALRVDKEGRIFLRLAAPLVKRRGLLPEGVLEFAKLYEGFLNPPHPHRMLNVVAVTVRDLPKRLQLAGPEDVPIFRLTFLSLGGYIIRVKDGVLYSKLKHLNDKDDKHTWWVSAKGFTIDDKGDVQSNGLTLEAEVQSKQQPGFVRVRYHQKKYVDCLQVQMEPGRFKPWRMLYYSLDL